MRSILLGMPTAGDPTQTASSDAITKLTAPLQLRFVSQAAEQLYLQCAQLRPAEATPVRRCLTTLATPLASIAGDPTQMASSATDQPRKAQLQRLLQQPTKVPQPPVCGSRRWLQEHRTPVRFVTMEPCSAGGSTQAASSVIIPRPADRFQLR